MMRLRTIALVSAGIAVLLYIWTLSIEAGAHWTPNYDRIDLKPLITKMEQKIDLTEEEHETILLQTGLGPLAVDQLRGEGHLKEIYEYQCRFFEEVEVECQRFNPFISGERLRNHEETETFGSSMALLRPGDILITPCSHFFGWRNGHAALVVTPGEEGGMTLESVTLGVTSKLRRLERWYSYPAFVVLRLKEAIAPVSAGEAAVKVALDRFVGVPYRLTAGFWGKTKETEVWGTQCAHLVWSCYQALGYDLDSDGGRLVTPKDLMESPLLEPVQIYGIDPRRLPFSK